MSAPVIVVPKAVNPTRAEVDEYGVPLSENNHTWYCYNSSNTVFVFVHGIFSNSRSCWHSKPKTSFWRRSPPENATSVYWPNLILEDQDFDEPSIFLGGFYTELINTGDYNIRDAAEEIYRNISISIDGCSPAINKKNIVFIAHSTGGIAVRHMLTREHESFANKNILLMLAASPSLGSKDADRLEWIAKKARQEMGLQLMADNAFLDELDRDFKNLVTERSIPGLMGSEAIENHFIVRWMGIFGRKVLVEERSAGRYFGNPVKLAGTDHFTCVKPDNDSHPSHTWLKFHWNKFKSAHE